MTSLHKLRHTLHALIHRHHLESGMAEETQFHLEARAADLIRSGLAPAEAARQARIDFGTTETHRDTIRQSLGLRWFDGLTQDLRYAARVLRKSPGFTAIAVASLTLAIGANTAIFSLVNHYLFAQLQVPRPSEIYLLSALDTGDSPIHDTWGAGYDDSHKLYHSLEFTWPAYQELRQHAPASLSIFAVKDMGNVNVNAAGEAQSLHAHLVDGNFYSALQVRPILGRAILPSDDAASANNAVVVISYGLWQRAYGGSTSICGRVVRVNDAPVTIIGVNPQGFTGAEETQRSPDLFLPLAYIRTLKPHLGRNPLPEAPGLAWVEIFARQHADFDRAAAEAAINGTFNAVTRATLAVEKSEHVPHLQLDSAASGTPMAALGMRQPLLVLLTFTGLLLLLACANVANLMLARSSVRSREIAVRLAIGASRRRIFRQLLTEGLLLGFLAGSCGLIFAYLCRDFIPHLLDSPWRHDSGAIPFSTPVLVAALALTSLTAVLSCIAPAWRASRQSLNTTLQQNQSSSSRRHKQLGLRGIVAFQITLSTVLVIGCVLFLRTVRNLNTIHTGFETNNLLLFELEPSDARYPGPKSVHFHETLETRIAALPGVDSASTTDIPFLAKYSSDTVISVEGGREPLISEASGSRNRGEISDTATVGSTFLKTMRIPILSGRNFTVADNTSAPDVAIVNQAFAQRFFPGLDPLGKRFHTPSEAPGTPTFIEIIGICGDTLYSDPRHAVAPLFLTPYRQFNGGGNNALSLTYIVRSLLPPGVLAPALRKAVASIDPDLPLLAMRTQEQQIKASTSKERTLASLTAGFGMLALALAAVGIYGVMAYTVAQRTNEIGIRLALGAARGQIRGMVLRETTMLAAVGVLAGTLTALALVHLIGSMLYGIKPFDPVSLAASAALLLLLALLSGWLPAARAARVEPMTALRHD